MKIVVANNEDEVSTIASSMIVEEIKNKSDLVLGLATGDTPLRTYKKLIESYQKGLVSFSKVETFNLDEYVGLSKDDVNSYNYYMHHNLFDHIDIRSENVHLLCGESNDFYTVASDYDKMINESNGIDLQVLGIGMNGHIGFNEPGSSLLLDTHVTDLDEKTLNQNAKFFGSIDKMPKQAITMGLGTIMKAKKIVLLVTGKRKASIIAQFLRAHEINTNNPASTLLLHNNLTIILDKEAAEIYIKEKKMNANENIN